MGILNVTPDSFSDGGAYACISDCITHAEKLIASGAGIIDVGGESTRPGSLPISTEEELSRVLPVIKALAGQHLPVQISIDTYKSHVAQLALDCGASIINNVYALRDVNMLQVAATYDVPIIFMHAEDTPIGSNIADSVMHFFSHVRAQALHAGIHTNNIWLDPGIGFNKDTAQNITLINHIPHMVDLGQPIVIGPSRKRFLGEICGRDVNERDVATAAVCAIATLYGAHVLRVHHVDTIRDAVHIAEAIRSMPHV